MSARAGTRRVVMALALAACAGGCGELQARERLAERHFLLATPGNIVGAVRLEVPEDWEVEGRHLEGVTGFMLEFHPGHGDAFSFQITATDNEAGRKVSGVEQMRAMLREAATEVMKVPPEKELPIREIHGGETEGVFFSLVDEESPNEKGDYRFMEQGMLTVGRAFLLFTTLAYDSDHPARAQSMEAIRTARFVAHEMGPVAGSPGEYLLRMPGYAWGVKFPIPGLEMWDEKGKPDGSGVMMKAGNDDSGVIISAFLEKEEKKLNTVKCRRLYFSRALKTKLEKSEVRQWEAEPLLLGQYRISLSRVFSGSQMHVHAYYAREDICMDIHLSKRDYTEKDRPMIDSILEGIQIVEADPDGP